MSKHRKYLIFLLFKESPHGYMGTVPPMSSNFFVHLEQCVCRIYGIEILHICTFTYNAWILILFQYYEMFSFPTSVYLLHFSGQPVFFVQTGYHHALVFSCPTRISAPTSRGFACLRVYFCSTVYVSEIFCHCYSTTCLKSDLYEEAFIFSIEHNNIKKPLKERYHVVS